MQEGKDRKYIAFISYRHLPLEMQVAEKLHRRIEHFLIPRELRKNGKKNPGTVFRDRDELPISSNLSENIRSALDASEFLIVICTPETSASEWVQREISYFLEHHDRDHVLLVLASGTPEESFPSQVTEIRSETGEVLDRVEPLAANIVADSGLRRKKLLRSESLRILAALIGCSYDALYRREQRYKARNRAAAAGVLLAIVFTIMGILANRNRVIQANYEQALRNQSVYLASESLELLEAGDRLGAIGLALEALPSEEKQRPYVSKAEFALGCALRLYTSPGDTSGVTCSGILHHSGRIQDYYQNADGSVVFTLTKDGMITSWDARTMQKRWEVPLREDFSLSDAGIAGLFRDQDPMIWVESKLYRFDGENGDLIWQREISELGEETYGSFSHLFYLEPAEELIAVGYMAIYRLGAEDGSLKDTMPFPSFLADGEEADFHPYSASIDDTGEQLAIQFESDSQEGFAVIRLKDGSVRSWYGGIPSNDFNMYFPYACSFPDPDHLVYITSDMSGGSSYSFGYTHSGQVYSTNVLHCLNLETGRLDWEEEFESSITAGNDMFMNLEDPAGQPLLVYGYANHVDVLDPADGEILGRTEFTSRIVSLNQGNENIVCILENGCYGIIIPSDLSEWYSYRYLKDNISGGKMENGVFWITSADAPEDLVQYRRPAEDLSWRSWELERADREDAEEEDSFYEDDVFLTDGCFALLDGYTLRLSEGSPESPLREVLLPEGSDEYPRTKYYMGNFHQGMFNLFVSDTEGFGLVHVDLASDRYRVERWKDKDLVLQTIFTTDSAPEYYAACFQEEKDDKGDAAGQILSVCVADDYLQIRKQIEVGRFDDYRSLQCLLLEDRYLYIYVQEEDQCFCADIRKGSASACREEIAELFRMSLETGEELENLICLSPDGRMMAAETESGVLRVVKVNDGQAYTAGNGKTDIVSFSFSPDGKYLLTVNTDGTLYRYRAEDGRLLGETELYYASAPSTLDRYSWQFTEKGFLALLIDDVLNLIDLQDWGVYAYVTSCYGYMETSDFFPCFTYVTGERGYGGFVREKLDGLMERGKEALNGWELSQSQKMQYGLEE